MCVPLPTVHRAAFSVPYFTSNNLDLLGYVCTIGMVKMCGEECFSLLLWLAQVTVLISNTISNFVVRLV